MADSGDDFGEFYNRLWYKIIKLFQFDNNKADKLAAIPKIKTIDKNTDLERNVDKVAMLLESIMVGAENLDTEESYCPVKPGFVKGLVEGAKSSGS